MKFLWRTAKALLLVAAVIAIAMEVNRLRERKEVAEQTVDSIHAQLDALDPATRAAVIARLSADEVRAVHDHTT